MSHTQICEWHESFKEGREYVEDDPCPGRPSTLKTDDKIKKRQSHLSKSSFEYPYSCSDCRN